MQGILFSLFAELFRKLRDAVFSATQRVYPSDDMKIQRGPDSDVSRLVSFVCQRIKFITERSYDKG
jgi:hypothetical protein